MNHFSGHWNIIYILSIRFSPIHPCTVDQYTVCCSFRSFGIWWFIDCKFYVILVLYSLSCLSWFCLDNIIFHNIVSWSNIIKQNSMKHLSHNFFVKICLTKSNWPFVVTDYNSDTSLPIHYLLGARMDWCRKFCFVWSWTQKVSNISETKELRSESAQVRIFSSRYMIYSSDLNKLYDFEFAKTSFAFFYVSKYTFSFYCCLHIHFAFYYSKMFFFFYCSRKNNKWRDIYLTVCIRSTDTLLFFL
jgi:hypothetical protein